MGSNVGWGQKWSKQHLLPTSPGGRDQKLGIATPFQDEIGVLAYRFFQEFHSMPINILFSSTQTFDPFFEGLDPFFDDFGTFDPF